MAEPAPPSLTEADRLAAAVLSCPGVARLASGGLMPVATYLPGRRVDGVRLAEGRVLVAVVSRYQVPVAQVAAEIRAAVADIAVGRPVDVHVTDIEVPGEYIEGQPTLLDRSLPPAET